MLTALPAFLQAPDTTGLRSAFRDAVAIVVQVAARDVNHGNPAHYTVDVGSFLSAAGLANSPDTRRAWSDIVDSAGSKISIEHWFCDDDHDLCPTIHATSLTRSGDSMAIAVTIESHRKGADRPYEQLLTVDMDRRTGTFRVIKVVGGLIQ